MTFLHENQYGFRARRSCESQLLLTTGDINRSINLGRQVDMGILHFSKAFSKVSHRRLTIKMSYYGIRNETLNGITEFLRSRQQVVVDGETSQPAEVTSRPTLFLIYISDNADNIKSNIRLFADDCVDYRQVDSIEDQFVLQDDLPKRVTWSKKWQMEFIVKCAIMNFGALRNKIRLQNEKSVITRCKTPSKTRSGTAT